MRGRAASYAQEHEAGLVHLKVFVPHQPNGAEVSLHLERDLAALSNAQSTKQRSG